VPVRYLKIVLVGFVSLMCLMYATQNVVNLDAAYGFVASATSSADHRAYPSSFGPALSAPALIWSSLAIIIGLEYAAGLLAAKGFWDLWSARGAPAESFNRAKTYAILGAGMAVVVWFGLFAVVGGAYFQMWQTQLGSAALDGAFQFATQCSLVLLFINMTDR